MDYVTLSNGDPMPMVGFGVFQITDAKQCEKAVLDALDAGYRHIDTAQAYGNEAAVGNAIAASGIDKEEVFVTTKVWVSNAGYENALRSIEESRKKLKKPYIDMVLIHQPFGDYYGTYRAMEELYRMGRVKAIGVSNFSPDRLVDLAINADIHPMVDQVETHVFNQQTEARKWMDKYGCRILNLSFGAPKASQTLKNAIDYAIGKGCIVVAAVGNSGNAELNYPAAYPGVIGVGSVNASKAVSSFSQRNESVKLVAPGEQVVSTYTGSRYGSWEGTSFAAPLVSGAAALLLGADDTLGPGEMSALLTRSAVRLGEETYSTSYGYGLLNIGRALRSLADIPGDLDCDGAVTMRDALLLIRAILHADSLADITVADMNGDGTLTLVDVLLLLRAAAM